jgi:hypothetical protein
VRASERHEWYDGSVRTAWLIALLLGVAVGACFNDETGFVCSPGEGGCECNQGVCLQGLTCTSGFCTRTGCEPGTEFCVCDEGTCVGELECFEGIVCRPKKGMGDPSGGGATDDAASASGEGSEASTSSASTSAGSSTSASTSTDSGGDCDPACGECTTCNANGECVPDPGMPCEGPTLQCADYVHSLQDGTCFALASGEVGPVCNSQGSCVAASPQDCDPVQGRPIAQCDWACIKSPALCTQFAPASAAIDGELCEDDGTTPECTTTCFNGSYSQLDVHVCSAGQCLEVESIPCDAYACENLMCNNSCTEHWHCAMFYYCDFMSGTCVLQ